MNDEIDDSIKNLDTSFQIVEKKIERQVVNFNALDSKIGILFGFVGVLIVGIATILFDKDFFSRQSDINVFFALTSITGFLVSLIFLVSASQAQRFLDPPNFGLVYSEKVPSMTNLDLKNQVIADMIESHKQNNCVHFYKARYYNISMHILIGSLLSLILSVIF